MRSVWLRDRVQVGRPVDGKAGFVPVLVSLLGLVVLRRVLGLWKNASALHLGCASFCDYSLAIATVDCCDGSGCCWVVGTAKSS